MPSAIVNGDVTRFHDLFLEYLKAYPDKVLEWPIQEGSKLRDIIQTVYRDTAIAFVRAKTGVTAFAPETCGIYARKDGGYILDVKIIDVGNGEQVWWQIGFTDTEFRDRLVHKGPKRTKFIQKL